MLKWRKLLQFNEKFVLYYDDNYGDDFKLWKLLTRALIIEFNLIKWFLEIYTKLEFELLYLKLI